MFKIGDFSKIGQVSVRMLRHYDKLKLLEPGSVDPNSGYRLYSARQLPRLHLIMALQGLGFSLADVKGLLDQSLSEEDWKELLGQKQAELEAQVRETQDKLTLVKARLGLAEAKASALSAEMVVKATSAYQVASVRRVVPNMSLMGEACELMYRELYGELARCGVEPAGPEVTFYHTPEYRENDLDVEASVVVADKVELHGSSLSVRTIEGELSVAALFYEGPFPGVAGAILRLLNAVCLNGYNVKGPVRELHLSGPAHENGQLVPSVVLEVQIPIIKM